MRNVQKISAVVAIIVAAAAGLAALETWAEPGKPRPPIVMAGNKVGPDVCECPVLVGTCVCRIVNL